MRIYSLLHPWDRYVPSIFVSSLVVVVLENHSHKGPILACKSHPIYKVNVYKNISLTQSSHLSNNYFGKFDRSHSDSSIVQLSTSRSTDNNPSQGIRSANDADHPIHNLRPHHKLKFKKWTHPKKPFLSPISFFLKLHPPHLHPLGFPLILIIEIFGITNWKSEIIFKIKIP